MPNVARKANASVNKLEWNWAAIEASLKTIRPLHLDEYSLATPQVSEFMLSFGRFCLWMCLLIFPASIGLAYLFNPEFRDILILSQILFFVPFVVLALYTAHHGRIQALNWANFFVFFGTALSWLFSRVMHPGIADTLVFYVYLPTTALLYVQNMVAFSLSPVTNWMIGFVFYLFLMIVPASFDSYGYQYQKPAFAVFSILYLALIIFSLGVMTLFRIMNNNLLQSQRAIEVSEQSRDILRATLETSSIGIVAFDANGELLLEKNMNGEYTRKIPLKDQARLENYLQDRFDIQVRKLPQTPEKIKIDCKYYLVMRKAATNMTIYAFIDISERQEWEHKLQESQKFGLIGQLTSGITHDYNNILAIALSNIEAFPREAYPELWREFISPVYAALEHARTVSHKLLSLSVERKPHLEEFDLHEFLREARPIMDSALGSRIELTMNSSTNMLVRSDHEELNSAILNIVINARNAIGDKQGGKVDISVHEAGEMYCIEIKDNGPGISECDQERIFEPFFTTKSGQYSTGLGLSIVKNFLNTTGGKIELSSRPGETCFRIYLPRSGPRKITYMHKNSQQRGLMAPKSHVRKILLVDDNRSLLKSTQRLFEIKNVECLAAENAKQAMMLTLINLDIEVAFLDLSMPDMNGLELGRELMKINPNIRYFIHTGNANSQRIKDANAMGFTGVLYKPLRIGELIKVADQALVC